MLENLKTRFPKTYREILEYHKGKDGFIDTGYPDIICSHQYLDILEFFDSVGIVVEIKYNGFVRKYTFAINNNDGDTVHKDLYWQNTRTAATEAAIEKCFEIREEQI